MPSIIDRSDIATFMNSILRDDDYYWVGPYQPEDAFFIEKGQLPGRYFHLLPQFKESEFFKNDFIAQFEKNRPKYIVYRHDASIFMTPADEFGDYFIEWMDGKYVLLKNMKDIEIVKSYDAFDINGELYILKSEQEELVQRLLEYQKYQEASKLLYERPLLGRDLWARGRRESLEAKDDEILLEDNALFSLTFFIFSESNQNKTESYSYYNKRN